jgi:hypothetical protein
VYNAVVCKRGYNKPSRNDRLKFDSNLITVSLESAENCNVMIANIPNAIM